MKYLLTIVLCAVAVIENGVGDKANAIGPSIDLQWSGGNVGWPCASTRSAAYKQTGGNYVRKNVLATRAQISGNDVFLALPRFKFGVPATLVRTTINKKGNFHTTLAPFPCWSMQEVGQCAALQSVVDLVLDTIDILWVLDTGVVNSLTCPVRKCPAKVMALHVRTGKVLKVIPLDGLTVLNSRLQYLAVDYAPNGRCYIYISDAASRAIIVFDVSASRGYRIILPKATAAGCTRRDVLYIALIRKASGNELLFTYLSSPRLFTVKTEYLQHGNGHGRIMEIGTKSHKNVIIGTDNGSAVFFRNEGQAEVFRWDARDPFNATSFQVVYHTNPCQLATHALPDYQRGRMRVLQSNFPDYILNTVGYGAVHQLAELTTVQKGSGGGGSGGGGVGVGDSCHR